MALTKVPSNLDAAVSITQSASDNSTNVATTAYVDTAIANLVDGAPAALNTLDEIAAALNDDAALNTTLTTSIATKLPLAGGTLTGALTINSGTANTGLTITSTDAASWLTMTDPTASLFFGNTGGEFALWTGGSEAMRVDGSGKVGIGTNSPTEKLDINGGTVIKGSLTNGSGTGSALRMQHSSNISEILSLEPGIAWRELRLNAAQHTFYIAGGERMRIDSSGNVLVNKTASGSLGTAGFEFASNNTLRATKGSSAPAEFNRLTNDGDIALFYKDTSIVGSIGNISTRMYIGSGDTGIFFDSIRNQVQPCNTSTGSNIDATIDLGRDVFRFKDIYLSGGAYLGGIGSANHLDDYEEGTYTATISCASGSISLNTSFDELRYTKIGNLVHVQGRLACNGVSNPTGATNLNLPFTSINDTNKSGMADNVITGYFNGSAVTNGIYTVYGNIEESSSNCRLFIMLIPATNNLGDNHMASGSDLYVNFTYTAA